MIHLDTSVMIDALTGPRRSGQRLRQLIEQGERIFISSLVLFEWRRGPRIAPEIEDQEALFPSSDSVMFGPDEALTAADMYQRVNRPRGRELDIAIAATAIVNNAALWTLNPRDFRDFPRLKLIP